MNINQIESKKIGLKHGRIRWMLLILIGIILLVQAYSRPYLDNWRCKRIADELGRHYGLTVRYGDPADFYVPPLHAMDDNNGESFFIGRTNIHSARIALDGVRDALAKYPQYLVKKFLKAIFIAGEIKIMDVEAGGTYHNSWIYISATPESDPLGHQLYEKIIHHELSSLFIAGAEFPNKNWIKVNNSDFNYLVSKMDVVKAAEGKSRNEGRDAPPWYQSGFVHEYGMSSMNNDFNMYAELVMTHPQQLKKLAKEYPKIKAKTQILVEFYTSLAPEMGEYFKSVGLGDKSLTE